MGEEIHEELLFAKTLKTDTKVAEHRRSAEVGSEDLIKSAEEIATALNIELRLPRTASRQQHRANQPAASFSDSDNARETHIERAAGGGRWPGSGEAQPRACVVSVFRSSPSTPTSGPFAFCQIQCRRQIILFNLCSV
ncbi:hypothetical protein EVAR_94916_1 [Eumeta japonica]|uniref:Uncharacterized protein n=1 Tax=Eumeta variegata TaxID=151549 RepID=A0A4C1Z389_EUMVA|nr:hypothetical protein EVAR_94916_1 [Eumeta japonica]